MSDRLADLEQKKQRLAEMRLLRQQREEELNKMLNHNNVNGIIF